MKFSLITVCLNSESTISDTLKSVIDQDYSNYEHIVFDGGSTDNTVPIIKSFGNRVKLVEGHDSGIFDAMNKAIGYATGEIIGIINSDDFYTHGGVLSKVIKTFEVEGVDSVYGDLHYVNRENTNKIHRNWKSGEFDRSKFKYGWTIPHPTFFVKKEVYNRHGVFDDSFKISGDYELILRFLYKHQISTSYIPEVLVKMRSGGNSDNGLLKRFQSLKEDKKAWKLNGLNSKFYTIPMKPLRKLSQFFC